MLFFDVEFITPADLASIESNLPSVVSTEKLTLPGDGGLIRRAISDCGNKLTGLFTQYESYPQMNGNGLSSNHLAAVFDIGVGARNIPRFRLQQVCINSPVYGLWSPLKTWIAHSALVAVYTAAWNRKLKEDKYKEKLTEWREITRRETWNRFKQNGLPIVLNPLSAPASVFEFNTGTWGSPNVTAAAVAGAIGASVDIAITYVDQQSSSSSYLNYSSTGNAESHPSPILTFVPGAGNAARVSIASLNPPIGGNGVTGYAQGWLSARPASGWNVYAGPTGSTLTLQNTNPIPMATKTYQFPGDPIVSAFPLMPGQNPDFNHVFTDTVFRG